MAKRTKKEALERLDTLPTPPSIPAPLFKFLPPAARFLNLPYVLDKGGKAGARALIRLENRSQSLNKLQKNELFL